MHEEGIQTFTRIFNMSITDVNVSTCNALGLQYFITWPITSFEADWKVSKNGVNASKGRYFLCAEGRRIRAFSIMWYEIIRQVDKRAMQKKKTNKKQDVC